MTAQEKAEKIIALAKHVAELDAHRKQAFTDLTGLLNEAAAQAAPRPAKKRGRKAKRAAPVSSGTREEQVVAFLKAGPKSPAEIGKGCTMPRGSIGYVLRRLTLKGAVVQDGKLYKLAEVK